MLKGILDNADARIARASSASTASSCPTTAAASSTARSRRCAVLPEIAAEAGAMTVMMDSGVRRGTDVLKALALGAHFVFVGRPFLYAAAVAGQRGVAHAIRLLRDEIDRDMALLGISSLAEMTRERILATSQPACRRTAPGE